MTADVQRELAEALVAATTDYGSGKVDPTVDLFDFYGEALLPTVQALIAAEGKRAAAAALEPFEALAAEYAERAESVKDGFWKRHLWVVSQRLRLALEAAS